MILLVKSEKLLARVFIIVTFHIPYSSMIDLILDPQLKYWVLLPISVVMVVVGLLRSNITTLLKTDAKLDSYASVRERQFLGRANNFKSGLAVLNEQEFAMRQKYFVETLRSDHFLAAKPTSGDETPANPLTDPGANDALMNMAKGNMMNYIPQTVIMAWINYFFAGFVIMKLPFPLTDGFKSMLQQGIMTPHLNVRYVSSISWYFVNLLGLKPVYSLLLDDNAANELVQQQQSQAPNLGGPGGPKPDKVFSNEAENVQIVMHESVYTGIVDRVCGRE